MAKKVFRSGYDGKRHRVSISFLDDDGVQMLGRTKQSFKAQCDVNNILRQYDKTGLLTHVNTAAAQYGDFTAVNEYQENLNRVIMAQQAFAELPASIRKRFSNDPGEFFEFVTDPANQDEAVRLGLAPQPDPEPVSPPKAEPAAV